MKVLFLTIVKMRSLDERGIYTDLLRKFRNEGHEVFAVSPIERRERESTYLKQEKGATLLRVKTLNLQKSNLVEKGIGTLLIEHQFLSAIKKYFGSEKFDLVLYSTPPITFSKVIDYIKRRDGAYSYLLLKDIFPQNAVDMGFIKKGGLLHKFFLKKEKKLYQRSDTIGCMSEANRKYILEHNPFIPESKVEVNPNSIEPMEIEKSGEKRITLRTKYNLPEDAVIFIYGGNLGIPQGVDFLLETIKTCFIPHVFFLIVGSGREYEKVRKWFEKNSPAHAKLLPGLPKDEYDSLLGACDVGMIFLSPDFTIPNFPSRLLPYLEFEMPVLAATDASTDIGRVIEKAGCGLWVQSGNSEGMQQAISDMVSDRKRFLSMKKKARLLLENQFKVDISYELIQRKAESF